MQLEIVNSRERFTENVALISVLSYKKAPSTAQGLTFNTRFTLQHAEPCLP